MLFESRLCVCVVFSKTASSKNMIMRVGEWATAGRPASASAVCDVDLCKRSVVKDNWVFCRRVNGAEASLQSTIRMQQREAVTSQCGVSGSAGRQAAVQDVRAMDTDGLHISSTRYPLPPHSRLSSPHSLHAPSPVLECALRRWMLADTTVVASGRRIVDRQQMVMRCTLSYLNDACCIYHTCYRERRACTCRTRLTGRSNQ